MRVLVGCEESQAVTIELRKLGHEAYSCDIQDCSGGHPEWHIKGDVLKEAYSGKYEMGIFFPPCTHLCVSGAKHFEEKRKDGRQQAAIDFFMELANAPIEKIAIENPVGIMSSVWRQPDDVIQPYHFSDTEQKTTHLWLKNLDPLIPTEIVQPEFSKSGLTKTHMGYGKKNSLMRSKTFPGIAKAMATQWTRPQRQVSMFNKGEHK